jgi:hypothetical protein
MVFRPDLTYFEDLGGHLKTTLKSKSKYLCIPEVWAFEFPQSVFKKSKKDWPQQPQTEKVLKFKMSFHDSVKIFFFQNIKIK